MTRRVSAGIVGPALAVLTSTSSRRSEAPWSAHPPGAAAVEKDRAATSSNRAPRLPRRAYSGDHLGAGFRAGDCRVIRFVLLNERVAAVTIGRPVAPSHAGRHAGHHGGPTQGKLMISSLMRARIRAGVTILVIAALAVFALPVTRSQAAEPVAARPPLTRRRPRSPPMPCRPGRSTASCGARPSSATPSTSPARSPGPGRRAWPRAARVRSSPTTSSPTGSPPGTGSRPSPPPGLNAQGLVIRASADGTRLWVGGDFTTVNGTARGHVAALNPADGSLVTGGGFVPPTSAARCAGSASRPTTVYVGGNFMSANGVARTRLAAFATSNGAMSAVGPRGRRRLRLDDDDVARPDPRHPRRVVHDAQRPAGLRHGIARWRPTAR